MGNVVPQERVVDEAKRQDANNISQPRGSGATERIGFGQKLKRNIPFILIMFKGSLPMTICFAMLQSTVVAERYSTVGYIIAMIAFLSFAILPRAKYLEALVFNTLSTCLAAALSLLAIWCGVKARQHTTPAGSTAAYNSSQAAVCAIWFFFAQWVAGTVRAKLPLLQNSVFFFSVVTMISMTYAPRFHTMQEGIGLVVELLEVFFIAFGVATGVSLLIFPVTTRTILFKKQTAYFGAMRGFVKKQGAYYDAFRDSESLSSHSGDASPDSNGDSEAAAAPVEKRAFPEREALFAGLNGLIALNIEIYNDTVYAKREIAYGKLNGDDLQQLFKAFRAILIPMTGIRTMIEVFDRMALEKMAHEAHREGLHARAESRTDLRLLWGRVITAVRDPFAEIAGVIDEGFEHAAIVLEFLPKSNRNDVEARGELKSGDPMFAEYMDKKIQAFHGRRSDFLDTWARERDALQKSHAGKETNSLGHQHVYIILHLEHIIYSVAVAVYELVLFADLKARDGTMSRKRLLYPSLRKISTLVGNTLAGSPEFTLTTAGEHLDGRERGFKGKTAIQSRAKDPQHLPPRNKWERYTNYVRAVPRLLKSKESAFGLRLALAAFSAGILAFLENTWQFYYQQKLIWTLIVILVSTNVTSGESTFKLAARVLGTVAAMVISYAVWYIVDGHPAGVIVFLWLAFFALNYGFVKVPKFFIAWLCIVLTIIATIGSALQSVKLGDAIKASGQINYPIYELAPYRLATIIAGCFIAYFWTLFPYPITDRGLLGEKLGDLLHLLAKFHDCGHSIASLKTRGKEGDMALKSSPGRKLEKAYHRLFHEIMTLIPALKMHALFQKFEFPIGGRFPANRYMAIMKEMTNIMSYINLLTHSTRSWPSNLLPSSTTANTNLEQDTAVLVASMAESSHNLTSSLTLLSAAVKYGIPLPPYYEPPPLVDFSPLWNKLSHDIQGEEGVTKDRDDDAVYSAWAVMQITGDMTNSAMERMVVEIRELVGEVDFGSDLRDD